jgi:hypothetical protein
MAGRQSINCSFSNSVQVVSISRRQHQVTHRDWRTERIAVDPADLFRDLQKRHVALRIAKPQLAADAFPRVLVSKEARVALVVDDFDTTRRCGACVRRGRVAGVVAASSGPSASTT